MRIAMLGQKGIPATFGGVEKHVEEISTRLAARGHKVTVFTRPYYLREAFERRVRPSYLISPNGLQVNLLPSLPTKHLDAFSHTLLGTLHSLAREYDLLHYHGLGPATLSILPKFLRKKIVITVHGLAWQSDKWNQLAKIYLKWGERVSARIPDSLVVVSQSLKTYFQDKYHCKTIYIPNGVNLPFLNGNQGVEFLRSRGLKEKEYILFVGRLVPEKGVHLLLEAFRNLKTEKKLVIAGGSSYSDDYVRELQNRTDPSVVFCGYVYGEELDSLYRDAYLCVFPSLLEGMPLTLLEALSYGQAVLASDIPEHREVLKDQGAYFHSQSAADLSEKLKLLLSDKNSFPGNQSTRRDLVAQNFSWDKAVDALETIYREVLKN